MAFVRKKISRGRSAYYLVENKRVDGKVHQRVLAYLGPAQIPRRQSKLSFYYGCREISGTCDTLEHAITYWESNVGHFRELARLWAARKGGLKAAEYLTKRAERMERRLLALREIQARLSGH